MLSNLLDVVNADGNEPDWIEVYNTALVSELPAWHLVELVRALWLETNAPEEYDALVGSL